MSASSNIKKTVVIFTGLLILLSLISIQQYFSNQNQLAQIISIETDLLKQWQQSQGLTRILTSGSTGYEVTLLQKMLSQDIDVYPEKIITGYYGNLTVKAVTIFQKEYSLPMTGQVDVATKDKLNEVFLSFLCPSESGEYSDLFLNKVNNTYPLPSDYIPPYLINISNDVKTVGTNCLRADVSPYLVSMIAAAKNDHVYLAVTSGYRTPEIQKYLFDFWLSIQGPSALDEIAVPGGSEHQLGSTVDLTDGSIGYAGVSDSFAQSDGGKWLRDNAYTFGFVLSYPKGKQEVTGFKYEPWHWRYVGVDVATMLREEGVTFAEVSSEYEIGVGL